MQKDGQQAGPFSETEIQLGISNGKFMPTDLAWKADLVEWTPISELLGSLKLPVEEHDSEVKLSQTTRGEGRSWLSMNVFQLTVLWYVAIAACIVLAFHYQLFGMCFRDGATLGMYLAVVVIIGSTLIFTLREHSASISKRLWFTVAIPICGLALVGETVFAASRVIISATEKHTRLSPDECKQITLFNVTGPYDWGIEYIHGRIRNSLTYPVHHIKLRLSVYASDWVAIEFREIPLELTYSEANLHEGVSAAFDISLQRGITNLPAGYVFKLEVIEAHKL